MKRYSEILREEYEIVDGKASFSSGVVYSAEEIEKLKGTSPDGVRALHKIKAMFNGRITK